MAQKNESSVTIKEHIEEGFILEDPDNANVGHLNELVSLIPKEDHEWAANELSRLMVEKVRGKRKAHSPDKSEASQSQHIYTLDDLLSMELPPVKWVIPGLLPAGLTIYGGRPKMGKSWMVLSQAISVATGGRVFGQVAVEAGDVLYLALEDNSRRLQKRSQKIIDAGGKALLSEAAKRLTMTTKWPRLDEGCVEQIECWLDAHPEARLVIVDTLGRIRPKRGGFGNGYNEDYQDMAMLQDLAGERNIAIVVVHHLRKAQAEDPIDGLNATMGLAGGADGVWVLERIRGKDEASLLITGRDIEERTIPLKWDKDLASWAIAGDTTYFGLSTARREIIDAIRQTEKKVVQPKDLYSLLPGSKTDAIRQLMRSMFEDGQLGQDRYGNYYVIDPNDHTDHDDHTGLFALLDDPDTYCDPVIDVIDVETEGEELLCRTF